MNPLKKRIEVIDALRGFAVLGILLANIRVWSGYKVMPFDLIAESPTFSSWDPGLRWLFSFLVANKFYAIFSTLFGIGFYIQYSRKADAERGFLRTYSRRLLILLVVGLVHMAIWASDILAIYAITGFILVALRKLSTRWVFALSLGLMVFTVAPNSVMLVAAPGEPTLPEVTQAATYAYPDISWDAWIETKRTGSPKELFLRNLHDIRWRLFGFLPNGRAWRTLAFFLLGYGLGRLEFFSRYAQQSRWTIILGAAGAVLMWLGMMYSGRMSAWPTSWSEVAGRLADSVGQGVLALIACSVHS